MGPIFWLLYKRAGHSDLPTRPTRAPLAAQWLRHAEKIVMAAVETFHTISTLQFGIKTPSIDRLHALHAHPSPFTHRQIQPCTKSRHRHLALGASFPEQLPYVNLHEPIVHPLVSLYLEKKFSARLSPCQIDQLKICRIPQYISYASVL